jgi:serine/threonine protein kinase
MDKYTFALYNLFSLPEGEYERIPVCTAEINYCLTNTKDIICKEQSWLYELCKSLSPDKETSGEIKRPWPKFVPVKAIKRGGEAFLLVVKDQWRNEEVLMKIPLPTGELEKTDSLPAESKKIVRGRNALLDIGKGLFKKRTEPKEQKKDKSVEDLRIAKMARFERSFLFQKQLHRISKTLGFGSGYIPETYEFSKDKLRVYYTQEYIRDAEDYLSYLYHNSDVSNLSLYLSLVGFIEICLHNYGIAHCDLAPRNILVRNELPVIIDFGISKGLDLPEITIDSSQLGSVLFASPGQMKQSKNRSFVDDIFSLGRILWITVKRALPTTEGIDVWFGEDGKIEFDDSVVASKFDPNAIPAQFRGIFVKTQTGQYEDISDFRSDLESLIYRKESTEISCSQPCDRLIALEKRIEKLREIFSYKLS